MPVQVFTLGIPSVGDAFTREVLRSFLASFKIVRGFGPRLVADEILKRAMEMEAETITVTIEVRTSLAGMSMLLSYCGVKRHITVQ